MAVRGPLMRGAVLACLVVAGLATTPPPVSTQEANATATRAAFLKIIDRPPAPAAPAAGSVTEHEGLIEEHVTFAADARERVPTLLMKSAGRAGRRPVVIVLHGTGSNKESLRPRLVRLARAGFVAVAIDGRYHGARTVRADGPASSYENALIEAFRGSGAHPFLYDTVWDV